MFCEGYFSIILSNEGMNPSWERVPKGSFDNKLTKLKLKRR